MTEIRRSFKRATSSDDDAININQNLQNFNTADSTSGGGSVIGTTTNTIGNSNNLKMVSGRKTPLLKRINSQSNSGSSTTSTIGGNSSILGGVTGGGGGGGVIGGGKELNYCEVYYLSPSKRKSRENLYHIYQQQQQQLQPTTIKTPLTASATNLSSQKQSETKYTTIQSHNYHLQQHHKKQHDPQLQINPVQYFQSDLNWTSNCSAGVGGITTAASTTNLQNNSIRRETFKSRTSPEQIFSFSGSRQSGFGDIGCYGVTDNDQSLDNFDILSHYSDSVAVVTKSSNNHHNHHHYHPNYNQNFGGVQQFIRNGGSSSGLVTTAAAATRTNNVTFSNCTGGGSSTSSSAIEERIHNQNQLRQHQQQQQQQQHQQQQIHSNRGSLRRSKGRSNQSLCSCDAGETTDIIPDPNRPLYQYSLDRKRKTHTYTCEQNAQILMRLEREKNSRSGCGGGVIVKGLGKSIDKQGNELNYLQNGSCGDYNELNNGMESDSANEIDIIPPPPPPISLDRKQQLSFKQDLMAAAAIASATSITNPSNINNNIINLKNNNNNNNNNIHNSNNNINCLKSSVSIGNLGNLGESMLNDCASTILNCANVSQMILTGNPSTTLQTVSTTTNLANATKHQQPDLCQMNCNKNVNRNPLLPNKQGLTLIVNNDNLTKNQQQQHQQHNIHRSNQENIPLTPYPYIRDDSYIPCFKTTPTTTGTPNATTVIQNNKTDEDSVFFYHQESPQYAPNFDNRPLNQMHKYNTIGPSSCYAKQLANHHQHQHQPQQQQQQQQQSQQQYHPNGSCNFNHDYNINNAGISSSDHFGISGNLTNGRYFSQSLTNFPFTGSGTNINEQLNDYHNNWHNNKNNNNNNNQHHHHHYHNNNNNNSSSSTMPYKQFHTIATTNSIGGNMNGGLSCSFGDSTILNSSSFTTIGSSNSGLKGKDHHNHHHHQHSQQMNQQQQQTSISNSRSVSSSFMPWKHRQCSSRNSSSSGTSSLKFDIAKHWLAVSSILLIIGAASVAVPLALRVAASAPFEERLQIATQLLDSVPLIDGHNDLPWNIRKFLHNKLNDFNFDEDLRNVMPWARSHWSHTDLQRLKNGRVSAQFWAAYVPCEAQHRDAVQLTLEQIDVIKRLTERYSPQLTTCTSASDIIEAHKGHKLCSLTGVEGGHSLGGSLAVLRTLYAIGVRYMTLTSTCHTPWADSSYADAPTFNIKHGGLTPFGKTIIREMNRLGMIVDLSHVSTGTMRDSLATTEAPVIFSHSSAYELCNSSRNVQDDILLALAKNGGLVMVNFYSKFLSCTENSTVHDAVAHINHIRRVAGIDHVGLGAGFDGINFTPKGLEDVSSYPTLFAELLGEGWSIDELKKLAGENFLRVMSEVEKIRDEKKKAGVRPYEDHPNFRTEDPYNCTSS